LECSIIYKLFTAWMLDEKKAQNVMPKFEVCFSGIQIQTVERITQLFVAFHNISHPGFRIQVQYIFYIGFSKLAIYGMNQEKYKI